MVDMLESFDAQQDAEIEVAQFQQALGPFVVAAERTRMPMLFTNAREASHPIIFANDSLLELTGFAREALISREFSALLAHPTDTATLAALEAGFNDSQGVTLEIECRRRNGRNFLAAICTHPVHDEYGNVVQCCTSFVDLSTHLERLRNERDALHALYQNAPGFIATTIGSDHVFTFANATFRTLTGDRNLLGRPLAQALPELARQGLVEILDHVIATGEPFAGTDTPVDLLIEVGEPQSHRYLDFIYQPLRNAEGVIIGTFCEGHDVTERQHGREQVAHLQTQLIHLARVNAMGTMAATLAHELSQPLTAISNYASACRYLVPPATENAEKIESGLAEIDRASSRARKLIERIKDMARHRDQEHENFDLKLAAAEAIALVRMKKPDGVSIRNDVGTAQLKGDRVQVQQVIINLVGNACDAFGPAGRGSVTVSSAVEQRHIIISVEDSGPGVTPEGEASLFEWTQSAKADGMGLGLSISRTIVEAHGGKIWLEANSVEGARFCFSMPMQETSADLPAGS